PLTRAGTLGFWYTIDRLKSLCHDWPCGGDARRLPSFGASPLSGGRTEFPVSWTFCRPPTMTPLPFRRHNVAGGRLVVSPAGEVAVAGPDRHVRARNRDANRSPGLGALIGR